MAMILMLAVFVPPPGLMGGSEDCENFSSKQRYRYKSPSAKCRDSARIAAWLSFRLRPIATDTDTMSPGAPSTHNFTADPPCEAPGTTDASSSNGYMADNESGMSNGIDEVSLFLYVLVNADISWTVFSGDLRMDLFMGSRQKNPDELVISFQFAGFRKMLTLVFRLIGHTVCVWQRFVLLTCHWLRFPSLMGKRSLRLARRQHYRLQCSCGFSGKQRCWSDDVNLILVCSAALVHLQVWLGVERRKYPPLLADNIGLLDACVLVDPQCSLSPETAAVVNDPALNVSKWSWPGCPPNGFSWEQA